MSRFEMGKEPIDVLFVVAMIEEFNLFREEFRIPTNYKPLNNHAIYDHFINRKDGQKLTCKTLLIADQGGNITAYALGVCLERFSPKLVVNVGISGRTDQEIGLADVVIATAVDDLLYRSKIKGGQPLFAGKSYEFSSYVRHLQLAFNEDSPSLELYGLSEIEKINLIEKKLLKNSSPKHHFLPIFSTQSVIDDRGYADHVRKNRNRLLACADMESSAVATACAETSLDVSLLVIRGVSDAADGDKKDIDNIQGGLIRAASMRNVAKTTMHILASIDFSKDKINWQKIEILDSKRNIEKAIIDDLNKIEGKDVSSSICQECEIFFEHSRNEEKRKIIKELARRTYAADFTPESNSDREINLIRSAGRDFLVAFHVMQCVIDMNSSLAGENDKYAPLRYVYPQRINKYCKGIIEVFWNQKGIFDRLLDAGSFSKPQPGVEKDACSVSQARAHICYLLGRMTKQQQQDRAKDVLKKWLGELLVFRKKQPLEKSVSLSTMRKISSPDDRMLLRTILISLVILGEHWASNLYVRACLFDSRFDELNRGFHLEYYGDIEYDRRDPMSHKDDLRDFEKTFYFLHKKIEFSLKQKKSYNLRDIELQTLLSLCQHRHAKRILNRASKEKICELLELVDTSELTQITMLANYTNMLKRHFSNVLKGDFSIREAYLLKQNSRSGWNDSKKNRTVEKPESILEHVGGGLLLIQHFLPETLSEEDATFFTQIDVRHYSKDKIIRMFLIHDWAEAYTGDLLPWERSDETKKIEKSTMSEIDLLGTYDGIEMRGVYQYWKEFEQNSTINARIANDIDKIENLMQLIIENEDPQNAIPDFIDWKRDLLSAISTPIGKRIARAITE